MWTLLCHFAHGPLAHDNIAVHLSVGQTSEPGSRLNARAMRQDLEDHVFAIGMATHGICLHLKFAATAKWSLEGTKNTA
jgi:hypothetical protein